MHKSRPTQIDLLQLTTSNNTRPFFRWRTLWIVNLDCSQIDNVSWPTVHRSYDEQITITVNCSSWLLYHDNIRSLPVEVWYEMLWCPLIRARTDHYRSEPCKMCLKLLAANERGPIADAKSEFHCFLCYIGHMHVWKQCNHLLINKLKINTLLRFCLTNISSDL